MKETYTKEEVLKLLEEQKSKCLKEIRKEDKCWVNYNAKQALKSIMDRIEKIKFGIDLK